MLSITRGAPKEMLPLGSEPMLQHVVKEAVASGLREICIVIREGKETIRNYFYAPPSEHKQSVDRLVSFCHLEFAFQPKPLGLGDALLQARYFVSDESFVMMVPDQLLLADMPAALQLLKRWRPSRTIWTSLVRLPKSERKFFTGARGFDFETCTDSDDLLMGRVQTEEETCSAYQDRDHELRGFGRTIYPPDIFDYLGEEFKNPETGEVDLLRTFQACTRELAHRGVVLDGDAVDVGTIDGYYHYLPRFQEMDA